MVGTPASAMAKDWAWMKRQVASVGLEMAVGVSGKGVSVGLADGLTADEMARQVSLWDG